MYLLTRIALKKILNISLGDLNMRMYLVGLVSSKEQAMELEYSTKLFVVGNRARKLAQQIRK